MDVAIINEQTSIVVTVTELDSLDGFVPGPGLLAVDATGQEAAYAGCTWTAQDGFVEPVTPAPDPTEVKAQLTAYAADKRWRAETGGMTVGGMPIATDDRSKQMIIGARIAADADANWSTPWVAADGSIVTVDAATMIAISNAVLAHVGACFAIYAEVKADIEAGTVTTTAEIDAAGWPEAST